jgi:hypothetical protein
MYIYVSRGYILAGDEPHEVWRCVEDGEEGELEDWDPVNDERNL